MVGSTFYFTKALSTKFLGSLLLNSVFFYMFETEVYIYWKSKYIFKMNLLEKSFLSIFKTILNVSLVNYQTNRKTTIVFTIIVFTLAKVYVFRI